MVSTPQRPLLVWVVIVVAPALGLVVSNGKSMHFLVNLKQHDQSSGSLSSSSSAHNLFSAALHERFASTSRDIRFD